MTWASQGTRASSTGWTVSFNLSFDIMCIVVLPYTDCWINRGWRGKAIEAWRWLFLVVAKKVMYGMDGNLFAVMHFFFSMEHGKKQNSHMPFWPFPICPALCSHNAKGDAVNGERSSQELGV